MKDLVPCNLIHILLYTIYFFLCISPWGFVLFLGHATLEECIFVP